LLQEQFMNQTGEGRQMEQNRRVTIADIAEELGLSTATVSNVIHGKTNKVSEETIRRVQELLEKRKYIPSMAGILLAQNDSKIVGVVVNKHEKYEGHVLEDGFIAASLNALSEELDAAGYFMMVKVTGKWQDISRYASMWNMVGLVLIGFCEQDYQSLRGNMHIPFVVYDGFLEDGSGLVNLMVDNFEGGRMMGSFLRRMGHENVLCIADNEICMDLQRYQGLKSVLPQAGLLVIPMKKVQREVFYEEKLPFLLQHTAVFAVSDYYAADLISFLRKRGVPVPQELSVAGFDDSMLSAQFEPAITTVRQDHRQRAALALDLLVAMRNGERTACTHMLPVALCRRESVADISCRRDTRAEGTKSPFGE